MSSVTIGSTEDFERAIAKRLGLDLSQVESGSLAVESDGRTEKVTWSGIAIMPSGFMNEVIAEMRQ